MIHTLKALGGMVVAPHHLAAQVGRDILRDGGNAIEAMVAAAACIAVTYPHMNSIGGDGFWLIHKPGETPIAIDACGPAAEMADLDFYADQSEIPSRGPKAALTVPGTIGGWLEALNISKQFGGKAPLSDLLKGAIRYAEDGVVVSASQSVLTGQKLQSLKDCPGFSETFLVYGEPPKSGHLLKQQALAGTLRHLVQNGLDDFYRGELAESMAAELVRIGSPLRLDDLQNFHANFVKPLFVRLHDSVVYNLPPPSQGLSTLMIIGLFDELAITKGEGFAHIHGLLEATKRAFQVRDRIVTDPRRLPFNPSDFLSAETLSRIALNIDLKKALPWPVPGKDGDTIWMGAIDSQGLSVSFIQSVYWEFGSGTILKDTGVCLQNRGTSFSLDPNSLNCLKPGFKPFHTLNPSLAVFDDGRIMPFGTMGGEGQPQTQATVFTRYARFGHTLQQAITSPRWLLGRTWGEASTSLKLEKRFPKSLIQELNEAGHLTEVLPEEFSDSMGHAGALVRHKNGIIEGAVDPRSDGVVAAF